MFKGINLRNTHQAIGVSCFTVLFRFFFRFIPMGRPIRCPGCKELKSAHDFGRPGKNCTGPVRNDTEQDLEAVDELEHTEEALRLLYN